jgi:FkbM family methyltransferase
MKFIEHIKLSHRAYKYRNKEDRGGIKYILNTVKTGQTVFDIGAHKGGYLYLMLNRIGVKGRLFAFEPQSILYTYLTRIKTLFNWNNVTIEHLALSDTYGNATLYIPINKSRPSSPSSTLIMPLERKNIRAEEVVDTETLDRYCQKNNIKPDFLKIDTEGNELNILKGGIQTIKKYKPKILMECEARHVGREKVCETFKLLGDLGYKGYFIFGADRIPLAAFNFEIYQNPLAVKKMYCNNFIFDTEG